MFQETKNYDHKIQINSVRFDKLYKSVYNLFLIRKSSEIFGLTVLKHLKVYTFRILETFDIKSSRTSFQID